MLLFVFLMVMSLHLEAMFTLMFKVLGWILILPVLDLLTTLELMCVWAMAQVA